MKANMYFAVRTRDGSCLSSHDVKLRLAKAYGKRVGLKGNPGGWIYRVDPEKPHLMTGDAICQGWYSVYAKFRREIWEMFGNVEKPHA